jgi:hypothetical protein
VFHVMWLFMMNSGVVLVRLDCVCILMSCRCVLMSQGMTSGRCSFGSFWLILFVVFMMMMMFVMNV